jgi:hypothetical protein
MPTIAIRVFGFSDMACSLSLVPLASFDRWRGRSTAGPFHYRSFAAKFRRGAAVAGVLQGTVAWTLEILVAVNVVGGAALIAIGIHARRNGLARKQCQSGALDRLS